VVHNRNQRRHNLRLYARHPPSPPPHLPQIIGSTQDSSNPHNSGNKNSNSHNRSIIAANLNRRKASAIPEEGRSSEEGIVYSKGFDVRYSGERNSPTPPGKTGSEVELANIDRFDRESE
jgi:hypothetical protein